jgi:hypothetical protein
MLSLQKLLQRLKGNKIPNFILNSPNGLFFVSMNKTFEQKTNKRLKVNLW